ncbi:MAG: hypothetical protein Q9207_004484 [Kuettlingeria erythrocarpa]
MSIIPDAGGQEPLQRFDFALLTPVNKEAVGNFGNVSDSIRSQGQKSKYHSYYCRLDFPAGSVSSGSDHSSRSDVTPEAASDNSSEDGERAGYVLSVIPKLPPLGPKMGWVMGSGNWEKDPVAGQVDLLLAAQSGISPKQLQFRFDQHGRLYLYARQKGVELDGEAVARGTSRLLFYAHFIRIGPLSYKFVHILPKVDETAFQLAKKELLLIHMGAKEAPNELTSATPSANDLKIGDWVIRGTAGVSATSVVEAASNGRTLEIVAVKRLQRLKWADAQKVEKEVAIYDALKAVKNHQHASFVMRMHSVMYKTQEDWRGSADEVFILWTPLGRGTFQEFSVSGKWSSTGSDEKLALFYQVCLGVQAVHELRYIHRDIKPQNLYVVSISPPRAVVGDFGSAIEIDESGHTPEPGQHGTIGWLAPELENPGFAAKYTEAVDVWSLGAVAYFLVVGGRLPWVSLQRHNTFLHTHDPARSNYGVMMSNLSRCKPESMEGLIHQMLESRPEDRIDLRGVLTSRALADTVRFLEANSEQNASTGSKRSAT